MMSRNQDGFDHSRLTANVVSAYVGNHVVPIGALADLISVIDAAFRDVAAAAPIETPTGRQKPAVSILRSVQDDHLACLECGDSLKSLKHHLMTHHALTPKRYREKWGLEIDYPMISPEYARRRSAIAKEIGFGRVGRGRRGA